MQNPYSDGRLKYQAVIIKLFYFYNQHYYNAPANFTGNSGAKWLYSYLLAFTLLLGIMRRGEGAASHQPIPFFLDRGKTMREGR